MTWESLRTFGRLSTEESAAQVRAMILAFLRAWAPDAPGLDAAAADLGPTGADSDAVSDADSDSDSHSDTAG